MVGPGCVRSRTALSGLVGSRDRFPATVHRSGPARGGPTCGACSMTCGCDLSGSRQFPVDRGVMCPTPMSRWSLGYEQYDARLCCPDKSPAWTPAPVNAGRASPRILPVSPSPMRSDRAGPVAGYCWWVPKSGCAAATAPLVSSSSDTSRTRDSVNSREWGVRPIEAWRNAPPLASAPRPHDPHNSSDDAARSRVPATRYDHRHSSHHGSEDHHAQRQAAQQRSHPTSPVVVIYYVCQELRPPPTATRR